MYIIKLSFGLLFFNIVPEIIYFMSDFALAIFLLRAVLYVREV